VVLTTLKKMKKPASQSGTPFWTNSHILKSNVMGNNDRENSNMIFERNMSVIEERFPRLFFSLSTHYSISNAEPSPERCDDHSSVQPKSQRAGLGASFTQNEAGDTIASVTVNAVEYQFVSRHDPHKHAERFVSEKFSDNVEGFVLCGLECGYTANALLAKMGHGQRLIIIEPDVHLFSEQLRAVDLTGFFNDPRVAVIVNEKSDAVMRSLRVFLCNHGLDNIAFIVVPAYAELFPAFVHELTALFLAAREQAIALRSEFKTSSEKLREQFFNEHGQMGDMRTFFKKIAEAGAHRQLDRVEQCYLFTHMLMAYKAYPETTGVEQ
jgi:hypothetical protein